MSTDARLIKAQEAANVWALEEGEVRKPGIIHVFMMALLTGIGVVASTIGNPAMSMGFVSTFWPGQAIQAAGSIWFGMWGGLAAIIFPLISNALTGSATLPVSIAYIPGYFVQGMAAGWAFRQFKCHPSLKSGKDWMVWTFIGVLAANAFGGLWITVVQLAFGLMTPAALPVAWAGSFLGHSLVSWILGVLLLKSISPLILRTRAFCKGYWA